MVNNFNMNSFLKNIGGNPQQFLQNQINRNPQIAKIKMQVENMQKSSGMSGKEFAFQYAKQNGISEDIIIQLANNLGIK